MNVNPETSNLSTIAEPTNLGEGRLVKFVYLLIYILILTYILLIPFHAHVYFCLFYRIGLTLNLEFLKASILLPCPS